MSYSALQIFPTLETSIREYVPRCAFYFGEDDNNRNAQPPKIVWDIDGGDPTGIERTGASNGLVSPKSFAADMIQISATLMGAAVPSTATNEREPVKQHYAASETLMCVLRWALQRSASATGWLGAKDWQGWTVVEPSTAERGALIECRFQLRVQLMAPEPLISDPPHTQTFQPMTFGA